MPNFIKIVETFLRTYVRTHGRTDGHLRPALLGPFCQRIDLKIKYIIIYKNLKKNKNNILILETGSVDEK